jgi:hypothetical protein
MAECDYCGRAFDDEEALLEHMRDEHGDELSRIDRRRVGELDDEEGEFPTGPLAIAFVVLASAAVVAFVIFGGGGGDAAQGAMADLPDSGDEALLSDVEQFESEGVEHVEPGTEVDYERVPPTSGTHYDTTVSPGFYESEQSLGALVHNLEHGHVVVYYDPAGLDAEAERQLREHADTYTAAWGSVVVVPNPRDDPRADYVLTAWRHRLLMDDYDDDVVEAFLAEFLGRGPENPVR